ncbi:MAG: nucleotidyltransferase family protein [Ilumatobacteraceae bacterium]
MNGREWQSSSADVGHRGNLQVVRGARHRSGLGYLHPTRGCNEIVIIRALVFSGQARCPGDLRGWRYGEPRTHWRPPACGWRGFTLSGRHPQAAHPSGGQPMVRRVLEAVARSGLSPIIVVTGAVDLTDELRRELPGRPSVVHVHHPHWQRGMASSLHAGFEAARRLGLAAVVVGLGDQPGVTSAAWRAVADTQSPLAVATYNGERRNPVRIHTELWAHLPHEGDEGARTLLRTRPELVTEVACEGNADDIDTIDDVARWQAQPATQREEA